MTLIGICITLFITTLFSGLLITIIKPSNRKVLKLILSFSGAFLFSISILNIIPELYEHQEHESGINIGIFIILGFIVQLILDFLSKGIEHGHDHIYSHESPINWIGLLIGICLHSFLEGMPFIDSIDSDTQISMLSGIIIHNIPISIVLLGLFLQSGLSKTKSLLLLVLFSSMTPLGAIVSNYSNYIIQLQAEEYIRIIMALVVGIFLHVSTSILFESGEHHQIKMNKLISVLIGISCAIAISSIHLH